MKTIRLCFEDPKTVCIERGDYSGEYVRADVARELLTACKAARELYDQLAMSPLEAATKYGDSYQFPTDEDCLEVRSALEAAIDKVEEE